MLNMVLSTEVFKFLIVELSAVISDDELWDVESINYMALDEGLHFAFYNKGQWFNFNPIYEIVNGH